MRDGRGGAGVTLYEPVALAWILITVLTLAVSGELFVVTDAGLERDCYAANARLLSEQREGPLQLCRGAVVSEGHLPVTAPPALPTFQVRVPFWRF